MSIADESHYQISTSELAAWVEQQGPDQWWSVDGDSYLASRVPFPCRADELVAVLRRTDRELLVHDSQHRPDARGQAVTASDLDSLTRRLDPAIHEAFEQPAPKWASDRYLWLCWKGDPTEWTLTEDSGATEAFRGVETRPLGVTDNATRR
jgi:hypothetical protein